jgi:uncharacterized caspase-like protein
MPERQRQVTFCAVLLLAGFLSPLHLHGQTAGSKRGIQDASLPALSGVKPGPYYALVIGNKNYRYLTRLQTPIDDANAVAQLLRDDFGFQTKVLLDADRNQIMTALIDYRTGLPENSNLLIYYAGHGHHDRDSDEAYWLPIDAQPSNNANWVSADDVTRDVRAMSSVLHILIISDSCYSGYLTRDAGVTLNPSDRTSYVAKMLKSKSRNLMSSGGDEPVADSGAPGHSVFASAILKSLRQMDGEQFTAAEIFYNLIQPRVGGKSDQTPQYSWIRNSGHDAGDFVFVRKAGVSLNDVDAAKTVYRDTTNKAAADRAPADKSSLDKAAAETSSADQSAADKATPDESAAVKKRNETIKGLNASLAQAKQLEGLGNWDQAINVLQQASQVDSTQDLVWAYLGDAEAGAKKYTDAIESYQRAISIKGTVGSYHSGLANAYAKSGQPDKAVQEYAVAAAVDPAHAATHYFNEGAILTNAGQTRQAVVAFDNAINADPTKADAYYWKGVNLMAEAKIMGGKTVAPEGTAQAFSKYLELEPAGRFADATKQMLASIGARTETTYHNPKMSSPKK